jgi:hypothetical protein
MIAVAMLAERNFVVVVVMMMMMIRCAVWVRNLVFHFEGGIQTEGFCEQSVEEDVWT